MKLVLASGSPRRREILDLLGLQHEVRPPDVDERLRPGEEPGAEARRLAVEKVSDTAVEGDDLILAADLGPAKRVKETRKSAEHQHA